MTGNSHSLADRYWPTPAAYAAALVCDECRELAFTCPCAKQDNEATGQVVIAERHEYEVTQADDEILISLELLANCDRRGLEVIGGAVRLGSWPNAVRYRVTGWHPDARALIAERVKP